MLEKGVASPLGRARAMVALCRGGKVPARLVTGFEIKRGNDFRPHVWVEALAGDSWESYDPDVGYRREMPHDFMPVRRDGTEIVRSDEATDLAVKYAIAPLPPPSGTFDLQRHQPLDILDLQRLPIELHEVLKVILLLPLGALVTAIVRTIVGLRTFGTFTPCLLALSFVYNDWRTGVLVLIAVLILGLSSRTVLDRLKLLLVPRLGIILTLVVLCMVFSISLLDYLGRTPGADRAAADGHPDDARRAVLRDHGGRQPAVRRATVGGDACPGLRRLRDPPLADGRPHAAGVSRTPLLHRRRPDPRGPLHGLSLDGAVAIPRPRAGKRIGPATKQLDELP